MVREQDLPIRCALRGGWAYLCGLCSSERYAVTVSEDELAATVNEQPRPLRWREVLLLPDDSGRRAMTRPRAQDSGRLKG